MGKITVMKKMIIFDQHFGIPIVVLWAISPDEKQELIDSIYAKKDQEEEEEEEETDTEIDQEKGN